LPWYNAYRFLIHNISSHEQFSSIAFFYEQSIENEYEKMNQTDKWILSALQILIRDVREEMQRYRLYNVVPALIKFLQLLTNWYVRLNRGRMKGHNGLPEQYISLQVLLDVLHKVNVLMSPIVPFLTEYMYQNIKLTVKGNME
jgi:isoleucyl-tRNA synthetase